MNKPRRVVTTGNRVTVFINKGKNTVAKIEREYRFAHELVNISRYLASKARKTKKDDHWGRLSYVTSAICMSYAAIEATLSEFIHMNALSEESPLDDLQREIIHIYGKEKLTAENKSNTLQKFNLMLRLIDRPEIPEDRSHYQNANLLRLLRNELIHPKPGSVTVKDPDPKRDLSEQQDIVKKLRSPLKLKKTATFPDDILTADCAVWASQTCERFIAEFERASGVSVNFILQQN